MDPLSFYSFLAFFLLIGSKQIHFLPQKLVASGCTKYISQMPVILIPVHFDRDPVNRIPSCARSIVLRPFQTNDFMTGVPTIPGTEKLPLSVSVPKKPSLYLKTKIMSETIS